MHLTRVLYCSTQAIGLEESLEYSASWWESRRHYLESTGCLQEVRQNQQRKDLSTTNAYEVLEGGIWESLPVAPPLAPQLSFRPSHWPLSICGQSQSNGTCEVLIIHRSTGPVMNTHMCRRQSSSLYGLLLLFCSKTLREKVFQAIASVPAVEICEQPSCFRLSLRADLQLETIRKVRL